MKASIPTILFVSMMLVACAVPTPKEALSDAVDIAIMSQADYIYGDPHPSEPGGMYRWCHDCDERHSTTSHSQLTEAETAARRDQLTSDLFEHMNQDMVTVLDFSCVPDVHRPYELSATLQQRFDALLGPVTQE
ncbi:MAG: hypothetical protein QNI99_08765 [Woeseiaceae bacterium]|nr:hypothetical protein [Woeseiaceae bacterium]